jgi:signal transduction histidine kinase
VFDSRQLERWNIRESDLPDGSTVYFRQPTIWEQYRWQLAIVTAIVLLQTALISILLHERRRRRSAEVYSRQRMAELAHVNRLSTAGELTASIAHELNQPLSAILTNAETAGEILKSSSPDIPEVREIISDIIRDDRRAADVIRSMRTLLKKTPFELKRVDLNEVVEDAVRLFSSITAGRDFDINREIAPRTLPVLADPLQLQQIILNLAMNALDAMKDTAGDARIIDIRTKRSDNFAELSVSDHGTGIPEDKLKAVFEPFYTSKAEGMGMGLAIVRTIVEAHSGEISAENLGHGGACFRIRIPLDRG